VVKGFLESFGRKGFAKIDNAVVQCPAAAGAFATSTMVMHSLLIGGYSAKVWLSTGEYANTLKVRRN
jgi:hypothetical protein